MTLSAYRICSRGVWDSTVPGISFNDQGVSNYALLFDQLCAAYPRGEKGRQSWQRIVDRMKSKGRGKRYDCVMGISGGTDSSFLLHLLVREYGLRPLAVNLDNGWNTDTAVKNIKKMTSATQTDLETYVIDYEEIKDLIRSYLYAALPWIDIPADLAIKSVLFRVAAREGISFVLRGNDFRSEGTQPHEWTYGDGRQLRCLHKQFGRIKLKTFPNYTFANLLHLSALRGIKNYHPFYYLDYQKKAAQHLLSQQYGWAYYGGHHHENHFTKFAISYWMYEKFGIDKRRISLSAQVLSGAMSREEALQILQQKPYEERTIAKEIDYVLKKLDLSTQEFEDIFSLPNRSFHDYPSYFDRMARMNRTLHPLIRLLYPYKPMSLFQLEMRQP